MSSNARAGAAESDLLPIPCCSPAQPCNHWHCDVRATDAALLAATFQDSADDWADACVKRTIAAHSLPLSPIPPSLIQLLRSAFVALDPTLADAIAGEISDYYPVSSLTDAILDGDWALHDGMISVRHAETSQQEVVVLGPELQTLEMIDAASRLDDIEIPLELARSKHLALPPYIDEPLLPATATLTTRIPRFKPIPTLHDMVKRMHPLHIPPEKGFSYAFDDADRRSGMTVTRDVLDVLEAVMDPFGGVADVEWMARVIGDSFDAKTRLTKALNPPLFATRNDPATLPPAVFSSSASFPTRADNDDCTFRALIAGIKQVDPFMSLPYDDGDDADGRHQQHDHVVPDSVARVLAEPLLTLPGGDDAKDTNTHSLHLLAEYATGRTSIHLTPLPSTPQTPTTPSSKRKRILRPLSPPIFTAAKDNGVADDNGDDARVAKRSRAGVLSPLTISAAVEFAMRASGGDGQKGVGGDEVGVDVPITLDEELERFFDFQAAASADAGTGAGANGLKGTLERILDEAWDVAATKTIKVPTLPPPVPFHAHADPWPSFRALLIRELGVRALDASSSASVSSRGAEAALMSWDPIAALRRAVEGSGGGEEEWGFGKVWRRKVLKGEEWVGWDDVDAKLVGMKVGEMMVDVRECISLAPFERDSDEAQDSVLITGVLVRDNTSPPPLEYKDEQPPQANIDSTLGSPAAAACDRIDADTPLAWNSTSLHVRSSPAAAGTNENGGEDIFTVDYFDQGNCHEALLDAAVDAAAEAEKVVAVVSEGVEHGTPLGARSALDQFLMLRVIAARPPMKKPKTPRMPATAAGVFGLPPPSVVAARECIPSPPPLPSTTTRRRLRCVAGPALMTRGELVRCLERDYAVDLVEWDSVAGVETQCPTDADLVVDGHTAIIYQPLNYVSTLAPSATAPPTLTTLFHTALGRAVLCCSLTYPRVRIVLIDDDDNRTTTKVFPPVTVRGLRAVTALASVVGALGEVEVRWCMVAGVDGAAWVARMLLERSASTCDSWCNREIGAERQMRDVPIICT